MCDAVKESNTPVSYDAITSVIVKKDAFFIVLFLTVLVFLEQPNPPIGIARFLYKNKLEQCLFLKKFNVFLGSSIHFLNTKIYNKI